MDRRPRHTHTIVRLYPFPAEVYGGSSPVCVVVVNGYQNHILREQVELAGTRNKYTRWREVLGLNVTFLVHLASLPLS